MKLQKFTKSLEASYKWSLSLLCLAVIFLMAAGSNKEFTSTGDSTKDTANWPASFGFGRVATAKEIAKMIVTGTEG